MMRLVIGLIAAALFATPALASEPAARADLIRQVTEYTDMPTAQVAIAGPDRVYSVERLGPPAATGEVIALVRAEGLKSDWIGPQASRSWDAHVLFDCKSERMRVIRSASYPDANRKGEPKPETRVEDWFTPRPDEPSAQLLAAACDSAFDWPLRAKVTLAKIAKAPVIEEGPPRTKPTVEALDQPAVDPAAADDQPAPSKATDAGAAAKPAVELARAPIEPLPAPITYAKEERITLADLGAVEHPGVAGAIASHRADAVSKPSKHRFAGLFSPFAKVASLGKRLIADGRRLALAPQRPHAQHAALGEEAADKVANLARAGRAVE